MRLWLLVASLTALVAAGCGGGGGSPEGGATGPAASALGWRELPGSPLSGRTGAVLVGVGGTAYVIGGWEFLCPPTADCVMPREAALSDGAAVDLDTGQWRRIADAPVPVHHTEAGVVGGDVYIVARGRLLRYDPDADAWARLGRLPDGARAGQLVELGGVLVVLAGSDEGGERADLVYDVEAGTWSELPDDPLPRTFDRFGVVDGDRLLVLGSPMVGPEEEAAPKVVAAWSFRSRGWSRLPDAPGSGYQGWSDGSRVWLNPHFGLPDDDGGGGVLDLGTDRWSRLPAGPDASSWTGDMAGVIGDSPASYEYASGWVLDARAATPRWVEVPPVGPGLEEQSVAAVGERLVTFGGAQWDEDYRDGQLLDALWVWTP
jgi:hypothetical protein